VGSDSGGCPPEPPVDGGADIANGKLWVLREIFIDLSTVGDFVAVTGSKKPGDTIALLIAEEGNKVRSRRSSRHRPARINAAPFGKGGMHWMIQTRGPHLTCPTNANLSGSLVDQI
jgi:hypothetical protein